MKRILLFIACVSTILLTGCSETEETTMLGSVDSSALNTVGKMKKPEHIDAPAAPQMPGVGTPSVTGVSYYSDARLTKPLSGTIKQGKTIYTKVVFSEPMKHTASDEKNARPILSFLIDGKATRYRIKPHRTSGKNFQSGDCKPLGNGTDDYICKYTVQADDAGMFSLKVGKFSMDSNGNTLANTYTHETTLQLGQQTAPTVDYYKIVDAGLERAHKELVKFRVKYDTPLEFLEAEAEFLGADIFEKDYRHWVIEQEFDITWNWELDSKTAGIYRRAKGLNEDAAVYPEMTTREYIKLRLEFPEETDEEILERYKTLAEEGVI